MSPEVRPSREFLDAPSRSNTVGRFLYTLRTPSMVTPKTLEVVSETIAFALTLSCVLLVVAGSQLHHDVSWYLVATRIWLEGGSLYRDIMEVNPPLAFYVTVPALWLSDLATMRESTSLALYVLTLAFVSLTWSASLLRRIANLDFAQRSIILSFGAIAVAVSPIGHFGQREHLFVVGTLPLFTYLVSVSTDGPDILPVEKRLLALYAFLFMALKPHFLVPYVLVTAYRYGASRRMADLVDEIGSTLLACGLVYVGLAAWLHTPYFTTVIPYARLVYDYSENLPTVVWERLLPSGTLFFCILYVVGRSGGIEHRIRMVAMIFPGCCIAYLAQNKGWYYHLAPAVSYVLYLVGWALALRWRAFVKPRAVVFLALVALIGMTQLPLDYGPYRNRRAVLFTEYVKSFPSAESVMVLSTNVSASFPFVNESGLEWSSRWPAQWLVPGSFLKSVAHPCTGDEARCSRLREIYAYARATVVEDIGKYEPDIVLIDDRANKSYFGGVPFDYLEFLTESNVFTRAVEQLCLPWGRCRLSGVVEAGGATDR